MWIIIMQIALRVVEYFLVDRPKQKAEAEKLFKGFLDKLKDRTSSELNFKYEEQKDRVRKLIDGPNDGQGK